MNLSNYEISAREVFQVPKPFQTWFLTSFNKFYNNSPPFILFLVVLVGLSVYMVGIGNSYCGILSKLVVLHLNSCLHRVHV